MKRCTKCGDEKGDSEFSVDRTKPDNLSSNCKKCKMSSSRLSKYGLTQLRFNTMFAEQGGLCAICNTACASRSTLSVDHDHNTGAVRGLLCNLCNTGIGKLKDSPEVLESAARYLRSSSHK